MRIAEVGDYITLTDPENTEFDVRWRGKSATVIRVDYKRAWVKSKDMDKSYTSDIEFYLIHGCYEIHPISGSPLFKALS